ncbi:tyrosine-type recombinase/integrase [Cytobacillus oceanisediminis]|uniref:tyrosine-type recombinase/integrase n=1 Tax=Cytobacillus oceanisediminis TaxID=665099 RepID=UPI001FB4B5AB|nr:site-specific integrase [Cytobacillus oceanisediminis]UOE57286.1 tyrosine-type recombinase/integrase [Cytobacillus oceanisediminis]
MSSYFTRKKVKTKGEQYTTRKPVSPVDLTLTEMFERFMDIKKTEGLAKRTIDDHYLHFTYFCEFIQRDLKNEEITVEVFRDYIAYMLEERDLSPVTVNIRIRPLKAFLRYSHKAGFLNSPIHEDIKILKTPEDTLESLTPAEIKLILGQIDDRYYAGFRDKCVIFTLLDTMVRISELLAIKRENVDLKQGTIKLEAHETKTKRARTVPISSKTVNLLREYISETEGYNNELLFLSFNGDELAANTVRRALMTYARSAGISKRVSPHTWRHTGALLYILNGGDPFSLQKILGHADMSMVRKYIQMTNQDIKSQHNYFSPLKAVFK